MSRKKRNLSTQNESKASPADSSKLLSDPVWAWTPYQPDTRRPWNLRWAGHLYRRAAFGATWDQLQQALSDSPQRTIDKLLQPDADTVTFNDTYNNYESASTDSNSTDTLRAWWLRRMIHTPHPLLEKMTLFWHNHFAVSHVKVKSAHLMKQFVQQLRSHALGNFGMMLETVTHDPALLLGLGADAHRKARPNEDFARQLLETFILDSSHFSETDIQGIARSFTGWFVRRNRIRYIPREHDDGVKKILGHEGKFDSKGAVKILSQHPATHRFLIRKLYRWLISEIDEPPDTLITPLAESFAKDGDLLKIVSVMLRSNLFFSPVAYRRRIKNPVEFLVGIIRGLEASVSTSQLGQDSAALGQNLYNPPTINGWPGGTHWINNATLITRNNRVKTLLDRSKAYGDKIDPLSIATRHGFSNPDAARKFILDVFMQGDIEADTRKTLLNSVPEKDDRSLQLRQFTHRVAVLPEFHLA